MEQKLSEIFPVGELMSFMSVDHSSYDAHRSKEMMDIVDNDFHRQAFPLWWIHNFDSLTLDFADCLLNMDLL